MKGIKVRIKVNLERVIGSKATYRGELKGLYALISRTQAGPVRVVKQGQEENSHNHVQAF